ncbi:MAG TPA: helix-turn-helix domain-containing protein [Alphaproteobacteria bacterium]|nr:helix-turn-helix domain-containing protein [Alphaproteobacteria bacterium]
MGEVQSRIIKLLSKAGSELTINDIASSMNIDRHTAAKNLEVLRGQGLINYREAGKSKLWKLSASPLIDALQNKQNSILIDNFKDILHYVDEDINIQSKDLNTIWSNRTYNNKNGQRCFERVGFAEKCKDCPIEKTFKTGKSESAIVNLNNRKVEIVTKPIKDSNNNIIAVVEIIKKDLDRRKNITNR